jgi:hypothetical protein
MIFTPRSGQTSASVGDGATAKLPKQTTKAPNVLAAAECMINSSSARFTRALLKKKHGDRWTVPRAAFKLIGSGT